MGGRPSLCYTLSQDRDQEPRRLLQRRMPRFARPSPCLERLDRLAWSDGACIESHGLRIGIRVNDAAALDELERRLPPDWRPSPRADVERLFSVWLGDRSSRVKRYHLVYAGISRRARTLDRDEALGALEAELRQAVAAGARRRVDPLRPGPRAARAQERRSHLVAARRRRAVPRRGRLGQLD